MSTKKKNPFVDEEEEHNGSVFGPKLTRYAAIVMVIAVLFVLGRQYSLGLPLGVPPPPPPPEVAVDSTPIVLPPEQ